MSMLYASRPSNASSPPPSALKRPTSPTFSDATTQASGLNINGGPETIITRAHLRTSVATYEELLRSCNAYRDALSTLSNAAAQLASSIEGCSKLRGAGDDASVGFQAVAGMYHLVANHERVLSDSIRKQFDEPLQIHLREYKQRIAQRSFEYEQSLIEKNRIIRMTEAENMSAGRRGKKRDLASFRAALATLQKQVTDLDQLKAEYYTEVLAHEEETWDLVLEKVALVVRSSLEVYDRISSKSSDPSLEPILQTIPDPFDAYGPQKADDEIFSILPVGSILSNVKNIDTSTTTSTPSPITAPGSFSDPNNSPMHQQSQSQAQQEPEQSSSVRTWMDQTAAARDSMHGLVSSGTADWYGGLGGQQRSLTSLVQDPPPMVDWSSSDYGERMRRHSLPTPSNHASSSSSSSVPFPVPSEESGSGGTVRPTMAHKREQSKLRQHLSVIGEDAHSSGGHSRESTATASTAHAHARENGDDEEDDDASTEKGSTPSERGDPDRRDEDGDGDNLRFGDGEALEGDAAALPTGAGNRAIRDDLSETSGPRWS